MRICDEFRDRIRTGCLVLAAITLATGPATGGEKSTESFYMVIYAARDEMNRAETSHCFATFARIDEGTGAEPVVELHHINWFSRRGHETGATRGLLGEDGRPARPEPGENRTTREALLLARRCGLRVIRWGPYAIARELYQRALRQIDLLEGRVPGRRVLYKAIDLGFREHAGVVALNCLHAVSDIDREAGPLRTWTSYGEGAARRIVLHLGRWIREPWRDHSAVWERLWKEIWGTGTAPGLCIVPGGSPWRSPAPPPHVVAVQAAPGVVTETATMLEEHAQDD